MSDLEAHGGDVDARRPLPGWLKGRFGLVAGALAAMWVVQVINSFIPSVNLESNGIQPRSVEGLDGILWSPFLHGGFAHLISNTIPFVVLSGLALAGGARRWLSASAIIVGLGGLLVWAFAIGGNENHIGASGWVFGLFGFLVAAAFFERRPLAIGLGVAALFLYGSTILFGFVPRPGLSWEGHLFGFVAGIVAARVLSRRRNSPDATDSPLS